MRGERRVDLGDQLALAVAGAQLDGAVGFGRGAVGEVGVVLVLVLQVLQGFLASFRMSSFQASSLSRKYSRCRSFMNGSFSVRPVILQLCRHCRMHSTPCASHPSRGRPYTRGGLARQHPIYCADNWRPSVIICTWNRSALAAGSWPESLSGGGQSWRFRPRRAGRSRPARCRAPGRRSAPVSPAAAAFSRASAAGSSVPASRPSLSVVEHVERGPAAARPRACAARPGLRPPAAPSGRRCRRSALGSWRRRGAGRRRLRPPSAER